MLLIFCLIGFFFTIFIFFLLIGNYRTRISDFRQLDQLTILIPFKGESIPEIVEVLEKCIYGHLPVQVGFVNDHNEISPEDLKEIETREAYSLIQPPADIEGKKRIMRFAMSKIQTPWVLWMDADLIPNGKLFSSISKEIDASAKMVLLPIRPTQSTKFFRAFFDLDFLSLHAAGLGAVSNRVPLLSNAACLLISRDAFLRTATTRTDWNIEGGDDVFAMFAIAKEYGNESITALSPSQALSVVDFPSTFSTLWRQRLRWMRKSPSVPNGQFRVLALLVAVSQISLLIMALWLFQKPDLLLPFLTILLSQILYLVIISFRFSRKDLVLFILPSVILYPFYLLSLLIAGIFLNPQWK